MNHANRPARRAARSLAVSDPTHPDISQVSSLRFALADLRERYDALSKAKEEAATAYKKDYRQWREFKRHVYKDAIYNKKSKNHGTGAQNERRKFRALGDSKAGNIPNNAIRESDMLLGTRSLPEC